MRLWVDDLRIEPEGWTRARTFSEARAAIEACFDGGGDLEWISLDHDLGDFTGPGGREMTGGDVALLLAERAFHGGSVPGRLSVHSSNPPGRQAILSVFERHLVPCGTELAEAPAWRGTEDPKD